MKFLFSLVLFLSSTSAFGFVLDADAFLRDVTWSALLKKVATEGEMSETGISQLRALSKIDVIVENEHYVASYITTSGKVSMFGEYYVQEATLTTETWVLQPDGKTWKIDQWFFYMTAKGDYRYSVHNLLEKEGVLIKNKVTAPSIPVEEEIALWRKELKVWIELE